MAIATRRAGTAPIDRAEKIFAATRGLTSAIQTASDALADYGADDPRTHAAWEAVEARGAIIHRQSRLLAGKSKGG